MSFAKTFHLLLTLVFVCGGLGFNFGSEVVASDQGKLKDRFSNDQKQIEGEVLFKFKEDSAGFLISESSSLKNVKRGLDVKKSDDLSSVVTSDEGDKSDSISKESDSGAKREREKERVVKPTIPESDRKTGSESEANSGKMKSDTSPTYRGANGLVVLPGEENDNPFHHIIALNAGCVYPGRPLQDRIDTINSQGGSAILAHPNVDIGYSENELLQANNYLGMEIYNGACWRSWCPKRGIATAKWDYVLTRGKKIWGFGVDDSHSEAQRGTGFTVMHSEDLTPEDIYQNLEEGNFYASSGAMIENITYYSPLKRITIRTHEPSTIQYIGKNGHVYAKYTNTMGRSYYTRGDEKYIRATIINSNGYAWTQPFWIDGGTVTNPYQSGFPDKKANFHCHESEEEVSSWYSAHGYSILAITDYSHRKSYIGI